MELEGRGRGIQEQREERDRSRKTAFYFRDPFFVLQQADLKIQNKLALNTRHKKKRKESKVRPLMCGLRLSTHLSSNTKLESMAA